MERTRRSLLAAGTMSIGVVGAAGCLGGGSDGNDGDDGGNDGSDSSGVDLDLGQYDCDLTEPENPDLDYRPVIVDPEADVVVQAFEDFTCGHCATYKLEHFPTIREEYIDPGEVRYEHWDFPIPVNETWAVPVASAARGVGAAGRRGVLLVRLDGLRVTKGTTAGRRSVPPRRPLARIPAPPSPTRSSRPTRRRR